MEGLIARVGGIIAMGIALVGLIGGYTILGLGYAIIGQTTPTSFEPRVLYNTHA